MIKHYLSSLSIVTPPYVMTQQEGEAFLQNNYEKKLNARSKDILHKVFNHPSIKQRNFTFESPEVLFSETPDERIERFTHWAVKLSAEAINKSLNKANLKTDAISSLVVNTCTGYICPGISTYLIEELNLKPTTQVFDLVGSGCGGTVPNLQVAKGLLNNTSDKIVMCVSVEICSCAFQMDNEVSLLISNALFSDGAGAVILSNQQQGFEITDSLSYYIPEYREDIRFIYRNGQLHNQLSPRLPELAANAAAKLVNELLTKNNLRKEDIKHWAIHSGGENVINALRDKIGLDEDQLKHTRNVLKNYGNVSSPTVLFVLNEIEKTGVDSGDWVMMLTFGAGFSAHSLLMRKV